VLALDQQLSELFARMKQGNAEAFLGQQLFNYQRLGELQADFQTFDQAFTQMKAFSANGFYPAKKKLIARELADLQQLESVLKEQLSTYQQDFELARQEFGIQEGLAAASVIPIGELRKERSKLLAKKIPLQQTETMIIHNRSAQSTKLKEMLDIDKLIVEQQGSFLQMLNTFRSVIHSWKTSHLLIAPQDGKVHFAATVQENQSLIAKQEVFFVDPENSRYVGELWLPQQNLGKVKMGQDVLVKLSSYPFQEFGVVYGKVEFISQIPDSEGRFLIKIHLPNGLVTNYGKNLVYKFGMVATAEVITEDTRLIEKVFYRFRKAVNR
jgi:HlyD family secretion protein